MGGQVLSVPREPRRFRVVFERLHLGLQQLHPLAQVELRVGDAGRLGLHRLVQRLALVLHLQLAEVRAGLSEGGAEAEPHLVRGRAEVDVRHLQLLPQL